MIQPGLNTVLAPKDSDKPKTNNIDGLKQKYEELALKLPWMEKLDSVNKAAPLAPELGKIFFKLRTKTRQIKFINFTEFIVCIYIYGPFCEIDFFTYFWPGLFTIFSYFLIRCVIYVTVVYT